MHRTTFWLVALKSNVDKAEVDSVYHLFAITLKIDTILLEAISDRGGRTMNRLRSFDSGISFPEMNF